MKVLFLTQENAVDLQIFLLAMTVGGKHRSYQKHESVNPLALEIDI